MSFFKKIFGSKQERELKKIRPIVAQVNEFTDKIAALSDAELRGKTGEFRNKIEQGASLDDVLAESFAVVREAAWRTLGMRHYDVQLIGGAVLHQGRIAEMRTGEGKTLMSTLPVYLNALSGKGVHVVTVNDYLASRDAEWMGKIYNFLGMQVGCVSRGLDNVSRRNTYNCDVTYGTNSEMGFDYLRDNMKLRLEDYVQRGHNFAIVDEVDSILIDEARTPLIISGQAEGTAELYHRVDAVVPKLTKELDFQLDLKTKSAYLADEGVDKIQELLGLDNLYDPKNVELLHSLNNALRAHYIYRKDSEYVVSNSKVVIVDEFTGRTMPGRRWSDGLHQAIEAKERVKIEPENRTVATITYQNFFLLYDKLSGMTGTAETEAEEFEKIYGLSVVVIPTNKPIVRADKSDLVYKTELEKFQAVGEEIREINKVGQPILVGTTSVDKSELLSRVLKSLKVPHEVLNAKQHEREATIVAQAGALNAVTIATNMAGRGTDILLGGNPENKARQLVGEDADDAVFEAALATAQEECAAAKKKVLELGGLHIVGTERHDSRRVDNQLRGRAGRQGDPGASRFYLSLDDPMMKAFGTDRMSNMMDKLGYEEGVPLEHPWLTKAIANAQKKLEGYHFGIRKSLKEYDDVLNQQRTIFYGIRRKVLEGEGTKELIIEAIDNIVTEAVDATCSDRKEVAEWDIDNLKDMLGKVFDEEVTYDSGGLDGSKYPTETFRERISMAFKDSYEEREAAIREQSDGEDLMRRLEREVLLKVMDRLWMDHLSAMDHLRDSVRLRGMGQRNPLLEYKREGYNMFQIMYALRDEEVLSQLFRIRKASEEQVSALEAQRNEKALKQLMNFGQRQQPQRPQQQGQLVRRPGAGGTQAQPQSIGGAQPGQPGTVTISLPGGIPRQVAEQLPSMPPEQQQQVIRRLYMHQHQQRNNPCWCGSGKKYKKCHMEEDTQTFGPPPVIDAKAGTGAGPQGTTAAPQPAAVTPQQPTAKRAGPTLDAASAARVAASSPIPPPSASPETSVKPESPAPAAPAVSSASSMSIDDFDDDEDDDDDDDLLIMGDPMGRRR